MSWYLSTPEAKGILLGIIIAVMLAAFRIPLAFVAIVGVLFAAVAVTVLRDKQKG